MTVDISKLSYKELQDLAARATEALHSKRSEELTELTSEFVKALLDANFEVADGIAALNELQPKKSSGKVKSTRAPLAVKYQGPNGETWTGQGRTPKWITESGKVKEDFAV